MNQRPGTQQQARIGALIVGSHLSGVGRGRTPGEDLAQRLRDHGSSIITTSSRRSPVLRALDMLVTTARARHRYEVAIVDVFSGQAFRYAEAVTALLTRLHRPTVLFLHGGALPEFAARYPQRVRKLFARAAAIVSPSPYLKRQLGDFGSIQVIPNPIDVSALTSDRIRPEDATLRVLWLRAFHQIYRPQDAVEVLARLHRQHHQVNLTMVGPDKNDGALDLVHTAIENHQLRDQVKVVSVAVPHEQVPSLFAEADLFLNTSAVDNTPVSVLEAMAAGVPVVSTNAGGLADLLVDRETALLTDVANVEQMANALADLLTDHTLYRQLQEQARRKADESDWSNVLPRWTDLIERLVLSAG